MENGPKQEPEPDPCHSGSLPWRAGGKSDRWTLVGEESLLAKCTGNSKGTDGVLPITCSEHVLCLPTHLVCRTGGTRAPTTHPHPPGPDTHERAKVKWKRWRKPRKVMKERAGKLRVVTWQKGFSKSPDGQSHLKPPTSRLTQVPPFLQTPGLQRPERALTSQCSPEEEGRQGKDQAPERRQGLGPLPTRNTCCGLL